MTVLQLRLTAKIEASSFEYSSYVRGAARGPEDQARGPGMPTVGDARPRRRVVDPAHPARRLRRLLALRPVPGEPRHLIQPADQPAQADGRRRPARTAPVSGKPGPLRVPADRTRPFPPARTRRPGRMGQRAPGPP